MIELQFGNSGRPVRQILCLGAHSDDIEIGCGGTLLRLIASNTQLDVVWVVFSSSPEREQEARESAALFLAKASKSEVIVRDFRDGFFPFDGAKIKQLFEELKQRFNPDIVFTHNKKDVHQDHRTLAELTWNTFRNHAILEYEIPKYDGDLGRPNLFVPLDKELFRDKVRFLMTAFQSQRGKRWFEEETFLALMRLRGMECNADSGYAEAFYTRKLVL